MGSCLKMSVDWLLAAALLAGGCSAPEPPVDAAPTRIAHEERAPQQQQGVRAGKSDDTLILQGGGSVTVTHKAATVLENGPRDIEILAHHGSLIALSDSYASKPRGTSLCQAGREMWFRVINTASREEAYARLVDSCWGDQQWGDPPVTVAPNKAQITLNLLSEPPVTVTLGDDGNVSASR